MSLTVLASVSLLALVSSARPVPSYHSRQDSVQSVFSEDGEDVRQAIQAVIKTHSGIPEEFRIKDDINVRLTTVEQVQAFLSSAQVEDVKAVIPLALNKFHSPDEKELAELLAHLEEDGQLMPLSDDVIDRESIMSPIASSDGLPDPDDDLSFDDNLMATPVPEPFTMPVVIAIASAALALLSVGCIALALYIVEILQISALDAVVQDVLPHFQKALSAPPSRSGLTHSAPHLITHSGKARGAEKGQMEDDSLRVSKDASEKSDNGDVARSANNAILFRIDNVDETKGLDLNTGSDSDGPAGEPALEWTVLHSSTALTQVETPLDDFSVPGGISVRELESDRPTWFVRAREANALSRVPAGRERRRGYGQSTVPGLDAALAMQLRPGFGDGSDAAWLVRFVMALFGWCAVLMSGSDYHV